MGGSTKENAATTNPAFVACTSAKYGGSAFTQCRYNACRRYLTKKLFDFWYAHFVLFRPSAGRLVVFWLHHDIDSWQEAMQLLFWQPRNKLWPKLWVPCRKAGNRLSLLKENCISLIIIPGKRRGSILVYVRKCHINQHHIQFILHFLSFQIAVHMQKPPMVHSAGSQSAANLQQQQQITQQPATLNSGFQFFPIFLIS